MQQKALILRAFIHRHLWKLIVGGGVCIVTPLLLMAVAWLVIHPNKARVWNADHAPHVRVGIVLGAGISSDGKPYKELLARLDLAADALQQGKVDKLLLSGDNRFLNYNEPEAMRDYLVRERHIAPDKLQPDYAGRSTYESCERAARIFGLQHQRVVIYSAESHLPRAIFLCRHFGIDAYGVGTTVEANNHVRREALAGVKALYNVYLHGERTVLGPAISL